MCLNPPDPHDFNPSLSACLSFSLPSCHHCHFFLLSSSDTIFLSFIRFLLTLLFKFRPLPFSCLFLAVLHSCNSASSLFPPPLTRSLLPFSSFLSTDHNRPETSVYRQSHRDISLGSHGCCHYCSGPGGKVRST